MNYCVTRASLAALFVHKAPFRGSIPSREVREGTTERQLTREERAGVKSR